MINAVSFFLMILFIGKFKRVEKSFGGGNVGYVIKNQIFWGNAIAIILRIIYNKYSIYNA